MKAVRFMRKPFFVDGYLVDEDNMDAIAKWCKGHVVRDNVPRPFVRVPVDRPMNQRQTQAFVGTWVLLSIHQGRESFKVYTADYLEENFILSPFGTESETQIPEQVDEESAPDNSSCGHPHHHGPSNVRPLPSADPFRPPAQHNKRHANFRVV